MHSRPIHRVPKIRTRDSPEIRPGRRCRCMHGGSIGHTYTRLTIEKSSECLFFIRSGHLTSRMLDSAPPPRRPPGSRRLGFPWIRSLSFTMSETNKIGILLFPTFTCSGPYSTSGTRDPTTVDNSTFLTTIKICLYI